MTVIRHDREGNVIKLNEARTEDEFRLFDVRDLRDESIRVKDGHRRFWDVAKRLDKVIAEKESV